MSSVTKRNWDNEQCLELIQLYESYPALWDPSHSHYHDKIKKNYAWEAISEKMQIPVADIKHKMVSLGGSFRRERCRQKKKMMVFGSDYVFKSTWFAYDHFKFLLDKSPLLETTDTVLTEDPTVQQQNVIADEDESSLSSTLNVPKTAQKKGKKRNINSTLEDINLEEAVKVLNHNDDVFDAFGKYIAAELRKYNSSTLLYAKRAIMEVILHCDTSNSSEDNHLEQ